MFLFPRNIVAKVDDLRHLSQLLLGLPVLRQVAVRGKGNKQGPRAPRRKSWQAFLKDSVARTQPGFGRAGADTDAYRAHIAMLGVFKLSIQA